MEIAFFPPFFPVYFNKARSGYAFRESLPVQRRLRSLTKRSRAFVLCTRDGAPEAGASLGNELFTCIGFLLFEISNFVSCARIECIQPKFEYFLETTPSPTHLSDKRPEWVRGACCSVDARHLARSPIDFIWFIWQTLNYFSIIVSVYEYSPKRPTHSVIHLRPALLWPHSLGNKAGHVHLLGSLCRLNPRQQTKNHTIRQIIPHG